jgi:hypothetical protein
MLFPEAWAWKYFVVWKRKGKGRKEVLGLKYRPLLFKSPCIYSALIY